MSWSSIDESIDANVVLPFEEAFVSSEDERSNQMDVDPVEEEEVDFFTPSPFLVANYSFVIIFPIECE